MLKWLFYLHFYTKHAWICANIRRMPVHTYLCVIMHLFGQVGTLTGRLDMPICACLLYTIVSKKYLTPSPTHLFCWHRLWMPFFTLLLIDLKHVINCILSNLTTFTNCPDCLPLSNVFVWFVFGEYISEFCYWNFVFTCEHRSCDRI